MKLTVRIELSMLILATMLFAVSCAPRAEVTRVSTPEPTITATFAPTVTPTAMPTATPTPATDEYGFTEERKAELNQQFQDFLNKQGEFTQGKMFSMMMEPATDLDKSEIGLGIARSIPEIQGYFFDYFEKDGRLFMLMGFDGKDGNRFITPVEIEMYVYKQISEAAFGVFECNANNFYDNSSSEFKTFYGDNQIKSLLDSFKNKVIVLGLNTMEREEPVVDEEGQVVLIEGTKEINSKIELTFGLFQLVSSNGLSYDNPQRGDASSIIRIETVDDAEEIDISKVPILLTFTYFEGVLNSN